MASAPATVRVDTPADLANSRGAAAYMSAHARASAASIVAAVWRSTGAVSITAVAAPPIRSGLLRGREVARHDGHRALVVVGRAELHDVRARLDHRNMTRRRVVGVARLVHLVVVCVAEGHATALDVAPVRALATVVREPAEDRRRVHVLPERLEADGVAAQLPVASLHHA